MIEFNVPPAFGTEQGYIVKALKEKKLSGDGLFGRKCESWFVDKLGCKKTFLTPSCTAALEMAAILLDIQAGDEIIMPSDTFVSSANAFILRGAKIIFVDIRRDTMNIDETLIERAITSKTKAIVPVHYAGVGCEMNVIMDIADRHGLFVVEDAAQGMMAAYEGKPLGTIGHIGAYSFHETKNYTSGGEGGLLIVNDERFLARAEIIREKGTNRSQFFRGQMDKYTWMDIGSSYLPSELQAAYLYAQLENASEINQNRLNSWGYYLRDLQLLSKRGYLELPFIPANCSHNAHMFYIKLKSVSHRSAFIKHMSNNNISTAFHYIPLHSSPAGKVFSAFAGSDKHTTIESERLVRLPMYLGLKEREIKEVTSSIEDFFNEKNHNKSY